MLVPGLATERRRAAVTVAIAQRYHAVHGRAGVDARALRAGTAAAGDDTTDPRDGAFVAR